MKTDWFDDLCRRWNRHLQLWRGDIVQLRGAKVGRRFGVGSHVQVWNPNCLIAGHDVTILDFAFIRGESVGSVRIGDCTSFGIALWLSCTGTGAFQIGSHCLIQPYGVMGAGAGSIVIGDHVTIGQMVNVQAGNHIYEDRNLRIDQQGVRYKGIVIEDDCWIGAQAVIVDGVTIGQGSVIGAGAVVTHSIPPYSVAVGNPARVIKERK